MKLRLRLRLALTYCVLTALTMAALGSALYITMERTLSAETDARLSLRADEVYYAIWPDPNCPCLPDLRDKLDLAPLAEFNAPGLYVQVFDLRGEVVAESDNLHGSALPLDSRNFAQALSGQPVLNTTVAPGGAPVRVLLEPIIVGPGQGQQIGGVLRVSQSLAPLEDTLLRLRTLLLALGLAALLLAGAAGWFVAYRGLRPLADISGQASVIATERNFRSRLRLRKRGDEVGQLANTIDHLLGTVEETLDNHRQFLADTSHELRNPLLAIRTNLELLSRVPSAEAREECLHEARQQVERMSRLVADLLLLAQVERGLVIEQAPVDLADVAVHAVREAEKRGGGQTIRLRIRAKVFTLGDEGRLFQVLMNLLDNAIKHTPPGGTIELGLDTVDGEPRLWVEDNGAGIPSEHLPHIFDRAYRINMTEPGPHASYGLGLAIVKYLTEAHRGRVTVESELGRGSRFEVRLPLLPLREEFAEPGARMGETSSTAPERELQLVASDGPRANLGGSPGSDSSG